MTAVATSGPLAKEKRSLGRRLVRWLLVWPVLLLVGFLGVCAVLLVLYRWVPPPVTTVQVQRAVEAAFEEGDYDFRRDWKGLEDISDHMEHAAVAAEDTRFYEHGGIDWEELEKARADAARTGRPPRGASTITQQLVKNLFLTTHRSYVRKGLEVPLTYLAEWVLPKERILELYLNAVEWGPGVYGIEAAAEHHYGTSAASLSREQAARLAALLPAPRSRTPDTVRSYSSSILQRMWQMGW